ncbi:MAG: glycosyltransferase [bacterium]
MTAPLVSILMPVRDDLPTLSDCLQSIAAQTLEDFEVVVVDDGSSDASPDQVASWARQDPRFRLIRTPPRGIVPALNEGLSVCQGECVARMDADDRMRPTRLERQWSFLQKHPDCDVLGSQARLFTESGEVSASMQRYEDWSNALLTHDQIRGDLFAESPIMHPTFFARRAVFEQLQGYRVQPWAEDYDFLLRAAQAGLRFGKVPEVLVEKRHAPDRLSHVDPIYKRPAMFQARVHYLREFGLLEGRSGALILGSGPSGKTLCRTLQAQDLPVLGFVDHRPPAPGRRLLGVPAWGFPELPPVSFLQEFRNALLLLTIGDTMGRLAMRQRLKEADFQEHLDFVRMI